MYYGIKWAKHVISIDPHHIDCYVSVSCGRGNTGINTFRLYLFLQTLKMLYTSNAMRLFVQSIFENCFIVNNLLL